MAFTRRVPEKVHASTGDMEGWPQLTGPQRVSRTSIAPVLCNVTSTQEISALEERVGKDGGEMHRRQHVLCRDAMN